MDQMIAKIQVRYSPDEIVGEGEAPSNWQQGWERHLKRELGICYPGVELDVAEVTWEGEHGSSRIQLAEPTLPDPEHPHTPEVLWRVYRSGRFGEEKELGFVVADGQNMNWLAEYRPTEPWVACDIVQKGEAPSNWQQGPEHKLEEELDRIIGEVWESWLWT